MTKEGHQQKFNKLMFMFMCAEEKVCFMIKLFIEGKWGRK
jgi:hypothetical protein